MQIWYQFDQSGIDMYCEWYNLNIIKLYILGCFIFSKFVGYELLWYAVKHQNLGAQMANCIIFKT
jgi:hypothetical protein